MWYGFPEFAQRIIKYDVIQNTHFASHKELDILVYRTPSYVIIYRSYILSNGPVFWPTLYNTWRRSCLSVRTLGAVENIISCPSNARHLSVCLSVC